MDRFLALPRYLFTRMAVEHAPEEAGIYGLFDGEELIYVGRASREHTIQQCLLRHQDGAHGECTMKATRYTWEISTSPALRETEVIEKYRQKHQREPRCQAKAA